VPYFDKAGRKTDAARPRLDPITRDTISSSLFSNIYTEQPVTRPTARFFSMISSNGG
jgi:hypothetical protein